MKTRLAALAALFFLAHLSTLPPTLEDVDSINFALGVRDFDVAAHRPHPPGYPVFIALGKASTAVLRAAEVPSFATRALAFWSAAFGALLVVVLFTYYRALGSDAPLAWWAMAIAAASPLAWFTALRPLSDVTGLAAAMAAQAALLRAWRQARTGTGWTAEAPGGARRDGADPATRAVIVGAALTGFAAGVRVQTVVLTGPLLLLVLAYPRSRISIRHRLAAAAALLAGIAAWGIPLLVASGGPGDYAEALGRQAGEDFSGVVMLWTRREARVALDAFLYSFVWPWGTLWTGIAVLALALLGFARLVWRAPAVAVLLAVSFAPYAVFHLLFHETVTVRYALPLVVPVAYLAAVACAAAGPLALKGGASAIVVASLLVTLPAARLYARDGSPALRLFHEHVPGPVAAPAAQPVVSFHAVMRRVEEWERDHHPVRVVRRPHGREWLGLVEHWRTEPETPLLFVADPRRTDLALFDGRSRELLASRRWSFPEMPFVAGTRPGPADIYRMRPPGWMLDRGWSLTAEVGGVTARDSAGPHLQPAVAWVRARDEAASLIVGGRNLAPAGGASGVIALTSGETTLDRWGVQPGFFFRHVQLAPGSLSGSGYLPLRIAVSGPGGSPPVSLEQFDVQSAGRVMFGYLDGWYEPEYNPATGRSWRWMSERGRLWVRPVGRDVQLTVSGESGTRYFDRAPELRVTVGGVEAARFAAAADFTQRISLPAKALELAGGVVAIESDQWFTPAQRGESPDERHLALRVYSARVE